MMPIKTVIFSAIALAGTAGLLWTGLTTAGSDPAGDYESGEEQETIRSLTQQGDILPLERILDSARKHHEGKVLETELERDDGRFIYEIEILRDDGRVREMKFDASTGELLEDEEEN